MAINIDDKKLALIERLLGSIIGLAPVVAGTVMTIRGLLKGKEISDAELDEFFAELDAADASLQAAINKRLGRV